MGVALFLVPWVVIGWLGQVFDMPQWLVFGLILVGIVWDVGVILAGFDPDTSWA